LDAPRISSSFFENCTDIMPWLAPRMIALAEPAFMWVNT